jgi:hypothetical protein
MNYEREKQFIAAVLGRHNQSSKPGMKEPSTKKQSGVFHPSDPLFDLKVAIDKTYSKAEMETMMKVYLAPFLRDCGATEPALASFQDLTTPNYKAFKDEYTALIATIFNDRALFTRFFADLPPVVQSIISIIVFERHTMWFTEIAQEFPGTQVRTHNKALYYSEERPERTAEFSLLPCSKGRSLFNSLDRTYDFGFYFPPAMRKALRKHLPVPATSIFAPLEDPPKAAFHYTNEENAPDAAKIAYNFIHNGRLEFSSNGKKPLKASLKKLSVLTRLPELYPSIYKDLDMLASTLLAALAQGSWQTSSHPNDPIPEIGSLRGMLSNYRGGEAAGFFVIEHILGHVRRVSANYYYSPQSAKTELDNNGAFIDLLAMIPSGKWATVENLYQVLKVEEERYYPIAPDDAAQSCYIPYKMQYGTEKVMLNDHDLYSQALILPLLQGTMAVFAVLGMAEIVFDDPTAGKALLWNGMQLSSTFDGIRAIRLTALGEYLLGKTASYTPLKSPMGTSGTVTLDEHRLLAKLSGENHELEPILEESMSLITSNDDGQKLYKMDFTSFLRDCRDDDDVKEKIQRFKRNIDQTLPPVWEQFFREVVHKVEPLKEDLGYRVFTLSPSQGLMRALMHDEVLKKIIIKAEGYRILVPKQHISTLRKRLEKHGYLFSGKN